MLSSKIAYLSESSGSNQLSLFIGFVPSYYSGDIALIWPLILSLIANLSFKRVTLFIIIWKNKNILSNNYDSRGRFRILF